MTTLKLGFARGAVACACLASAVLWACGSSTTSTNTTPPGTSGGGDDSGAAAAANGSCKRTDLKIAFAPMYSAFVTDAPHSFQVPAIVSGVTSGLTWKASDTTAVQLAPGDKGGTMITVLKAGGPVTIEAYAGDPSLAATPCGSSVLTITSATQAQWQAGSDRYNNGNIFVIPDGGFGDASDFDASALNTLACTNCHGASATNLAFKTIAHTPEQAGGFSDTDLQNIITQGVIPAGGYFDDSIVPRGAFPYFHQWTASPEELTGLIVYLRSLTPTPQGGSADFGGLGGGGGGGGGNDSGPPADDAGGKADAAGPSDAGPG